MHRILVTLLTLILLLQFLSADNDETTGMTTVASVKEIGNEIFTPHHGKNSRISSNNTKPHHKKRPMRTVDDAVESVKEFGHQVGDGIEGAWNKTVNWFQSIFGRR